MFPISDTIKSGKFPFFTLALIVVTIFVFIQQLTHASVGGLVEEYALIPDDIHFTNYITLVPFVTAIFLHGGLLHILSNMWFLWIFGDDIEGTLGWPLFILLYFASGIAGNLAQYLLSPQSQIPVLGASGAVAGVLGAYFILFPYAKVKTLIPVFGFLTIIEIPALFMLGYWFVLQIISGATSLGLTQETGGIAFWAHVVGFVTGIIFGKLFSGKVAATQLRRIE